MAGSDLAISSCGHRGYILAGVSSSAGSRGWGRAALKAHYSSPGVWQGLLHGGLWGLVLLNIMARYPAWAHLLLEGSLQLAGLKNTFTDLKHLEVSLWKRSKLPSPRMKCGQDLPEVGW